MTRRSSSSIAFIALLCLTVLGVGGAAGYGGAAPYAVKVTGPSRAVDCGTTVRLTATVRTLESGAPVKQQYVRWSIAQGSSKDALSASRSLTNADGQATVQLTIGKALGDRRVIGEAGGVDGRAVVKVDCVLPTPTPTPRPTPRPRVTPKPTPRPTPRPRATPKPTPRPTKAPVVVERERLTVGYREEDLAGRAPFLFAEAEGLWTDAGLKRVTQTFAPDPLAGILDGSLDAAVMSLDTALAAIAAGQPVRILSGYHQYQSDIVAVGTGIPDVAGLAGLPVVVGDDARVATRLAALADAGWDLSSVEVQEVVPDGGVDAWVDQLVAGDLSMTPMLNRHRLQVARANGTIALDRQVYGDDVIVTSAQTVADAPRALTAFLTGTIAALGRLSDPASDETLFAAADAAGIATTPTVRTGWLNDVEDLRPWDGSFGDQAIGDGLGELDAFAKEQLGWVPLPADHIELDLLAAAQSATGLSPAPALPELPAAVDPSIGIGTATAGPDVRAPLLLATASGAFERAGIEDVVLSEGDGIAGILDGSLDLAVVTAEDAAAAIAAGDAIAIVAGYQPAAASPTVLIAAADRAPEELAPAMAALLRGLADLNLPDALDRVLAAGGDGAGVDAATWPAIVATFAPFDGSMVETGADPHPTLAQARASVGLSAAEPAS